MRYGALLLVGACSMPSPELNVETGDLNAAPELLAASLGCEDADGATVWAFEAEVFDADGDHDIVEVHAFVYDEEADVLVDDLALERLTPGRWSVALPVDATGLDCGYGRYSADFVAQDASGASDAISAFAPSTGGSLGGP